MTSFSRWFNKPIKNLNNRQIEILSVLSETEWMTIKEVANGTEFSYQSCANNLSKMAYFKLIEESGDDTGYKYTYRKKKRDEILKQLNEN